jgi:hypothetical protein
MASRNDHYNTQFYFLLMCEVALSGRTGVEIRPLRKNSALNNFVWSYLAQGEKLQLFYVRVKVFYFHELSKENA